MVREWDAVSYDTLPLPHVQWGARAIRRLTLTGRERVLDAGCGTGRVTEQLLERLPDGRVVALDGSRSMLDQLQVRLASSLDRVELVHADLRRPLPLTEPVDAILSTATFHWLPDHAALFRHLAAVLHPGGQLVAEWGGRGNVARINRVLEELGFDQAPIWNFAGPDETAQHLAAAGFTDVHTWLQPDPAYLPPGEPFEAYLATVVLGAHLDPLPAAERPALVREVARHLGAPEVDYVRLNITARQAENP